MIIFNYKLYSERFSKVLKFIDLTFVIQISNSNKRSFKDKVLRSLKKYDLKGCPRSNCKLSLRKINVIYVHSLIVIIIMFLDRYPCTEVGWN
jgi:hypothetical protein